MDVLTAIKERRSVRKYLSKPVEEEKLLRVLEAARLAPSANNKQEWKFIVVRDSKKIERMVDAVNGQSFVGQAPVIIVCCGLDPKGVMSCGQPRHSVDVSIATAYMLLEAHVQGLGTCWLGNFDEQKVRDLLEIPDNVRVVSITPLGYPEVHPGRRPRKAMEEIVSYDKFL